jgi:hypothetical protein
MKYFRLSSLKRLFPRRSVSASVRSLLALTLLASQIQAAGARAGETLYNGIELPSPWPPHLSDFTVSVEKTLSFSLPGFTAEGHRHRCGTPAFCG